MKAEDTPTVQSPDHDILISLRVTLEAFIAEVRGNNAATTAQYTDHEARIRVLQASVERFDGAARAFKWLSGAIAAFVSILVSLISLFLAGGLKK